MPTAVITDFAKFPEPLVLGAMKLYAIGQRAKWKAYVNLYFLSKHYTLKEITSKTCDLFPNEFDEKLGRIQLTYFEDVNYSEQVDFMPGFAVSDEEVKKELARIELE